MKKIIARIFFACLVFLTCTGISQFPSGVLAPVKQQDINNLRDEQMKELLMSRINHLGTFQNTPAKPSACDLSAPSWDWAITMGGKGGAYASCIMSDASNNYYVIGTFNGTANFGTQSKTSSGMWDVFLAKYSSTGTLIWVDQIKSDINQTSKGIGISLDGSGNVYVSGNFQSTIHFGTTSLSSQGGVDAFAAKYDNSGTFLWAKSYGSAYADETVVGMASDPSGNSYIAGNGPNGEFLVKYSTTGQKSWETETSATASDIAYSSSGIYVTGYILGTTSFGSITLNPPNSGHSAYVSKQDASGIFTWADYVSSTDGESAGTSITLDNSGNFFIAGWFNSTVTFIPSSVSLTSGYTPFFIAKYNTSGICQWATQVTQNLESSLPVQIFTGPGNTLYACGTDDVDFAFGTSSVTGSPKFLAKLDATGSPQWAKSLDYSAAKSCVSADNKIIQVGGKSYNFFLSSLDLDGTLEWIQSTTSDGGYADSWYTFSTDVAGDSYVQGHLSGTGNFLGTTLTGEGGYIAKISPLHTMAWIKTLTLPIGKQTMDPSGIINDKDNNSYSWGTFSDSLIIEGAWNINPAHSGTMGYLVKYDKDGNYKWTRMFSSTQGIIGAGGIAADTSGNIWITGQFNGIITIGTYTFPAPVYYNTFIAKYNPAGDLQFAKSFTGSSSSWNIWGRSISCDQQNNMIFAGLFVGTVNFGTSSLTTLGSNDIFLAKFDPAGNEIWAKDAGGTSSERASAVATDKNGNSYITGFFYGHSISFDAITITSPYSGGMNLYLAKYSPGGNALWARALGSPTYSWPLYGLGVDQYGNCYVGGDYTDTIKLENGPALTGNGYCHFVAKYSTSGAYEWSQNLSSELPSGLSGVLSTSAIGDNIVYAGGRISGEVIPFGTIPLGTASTNGFIASLGTDVGIPSITQSNAGCTLFPNPASQTIYLDFDKQPVNAVHYSISDLTGKILMIKTAEPAKRIKVSLPDLTSGIYFITIKNEMGEYTKKIVVE